MLLWWALFVGGVVAVAEEESVYRRVEAANTSRLLEVVESLRLRVFAMEHDSFEGRRHFGAMGEELEELVPSAVTAGRVVTKSGSLATATHVDVNVLFMHGVGAVQELAAREARLDEAAKAAAALAGETSRRFGKVRAAIEARADEGDQRRVDDEVRRRREIAADDDVAQSEARAEAAAMGRRDSVDRATLTVEDDRARTGIRAEDAAERARAAERSRQARDASAREEALKRQTDAALLEQRLENERALEVQRREAELSRVRAEAEAAARSERENEAVRLRALRAQMAEDRRKLLEAVALVARAVGRGAAALLDDPRSLATLVAAIVAVVAGGLFAREAAKLARSLAEAYLGRPRLVRETSRRRFAMCRRLARASASVALSRLTSARRALRAATGTACRAAKGLGLFVASMTFLKPEVRDRILRADADAYEARKAAEAARRDADGRRARARFLEEQARFLEGVVLPASLRDRVLQLAIANRNAKRNGSAFRHMLLHGPPGTGKTLVARRLAKASNLEYALMSGGDVGPLGADGVTALHALFRWGRASDTGVLIFIDEAEAFLASRSRAQLTEHMRNALNAFLYQTGTPTRAFLLVLATNRANDLDDAVLDRVDETLYFDFPTKPERRILVDLYYRAYVASLAANGNRRLSALVRNLLELPSPIRLADDLDRSALDAAADATDGFSGREIEKLMVAVQSAAYANGGRLDSNVFRAVVDHKARQHAYKAFLEDDAAHRAPKSTAVPFVDAQDKLLQEQREVEIIAKMNASDGFLAELLARNALNSSDPFAR